ncbi:hypothetical protein E2C01_001385 [Portunus trituberculatus]|uniref:Uncharacterized protein n=1 Tax=Portunus trituberculatus TaxID=210409 RepID=A0A5B7CME9_PORTR|nr:hypothetical protein [Portunus trituberculatus]
MVTLCENLGGGGTANATPLRIRPQTPAPLTSTTGSEFGGYWYFGVPIFGVHPYWIVVRNGPCLTNLQFGIEDSDDKAVFVVLSPLAATWHRLSLYSNGILYLIL